ncbi:MAG: class I SAM-dependent methyltransferase [Planctomycetes bacterium]|nr:class I SAM-dependent methyltransferase [Planctomycetota bacterium]
MTDTILCRDSGVELLDRVDRLLDTGNVAEGVRRLFVGLDHVRATRNAQSWRRFAETDAIAHPLCAKIHEDPLTRHSFTKPRGYAGDAVLLDYIYGLCSRDEATPRGRLVGDVASGRAPAAAVRYRRDLIAYRIDQIAERAPEPARVLSVACGHFREGRMSVAVQNGGLAEVVALDSDANSLREVEASSPRCVRPVELSVRGLLGRRVGSELGDFDFVYSAGLYDYLDDRVATALTAKMFDLLRPGGRLLVCNFLPDCPDVGYMESFMGWRLIYRTMRAIGRLADAVPKDQVAAVEQFEDGFGSVGYLELKKVAR